jgi:DNA-binding MarR family transcriptional regulator
MLLQGILSGGTEKSITQLAQEVDMDRSTIGRNLRVLSRDGFVTLGVGSDRREHVVRVTEEGRQAVACALPLWQKAQSMMVNALGQNQLDTLRTLLSRLEAASS